MKIIADIVLFISSGLLAVMFFNRSDFYGIGNLFVPKSTVLYILAGVVLIAGGFTRLLGPEMITAK